MTELVVFTDLLHRSPPRSFVRHPARVDERCLWPLATRDRPGLAPHWRALSSHRIGKTVRERHGAAAAKPAAKPAQVTPRGRVGIHRTLCTRQRRRTMTTQLFDQAQDAWEQRHVGLQ